MGIFIFQNAVVKPHAGRDDFEGGIGRKARFAQLRLIEAVLAGGRVVQNSAAGKLPKQVANFPLGRGRLGLCRGGRPGRCLLRRAGNGRRGTAGRARAAPGQKAGTQAQAEKKRQKGPEEVCLPHRNAPVKNMEMALPLSILPHSAQVFLIFRLLFTGRGGGLYGPFLPLRPAAGRRGRLWRKGAGLRFSMGACRAADGHKGKSPRGYGLAGFAFCITGRGHRPWQAAATAQ